VFETGLLIVGFLRCFFYLSYFI